VKCPSRGRGALLDGLRDRLDTPLFTTEELVPAADRLTRSKAPGLDGIPNEILTAVARKSPGTLLGVYNACLLESTFPRNWKRSKLVLLHKGPDKPITNTSSFRPLCMLDTAGKLLERMLLPCALQD